LTNGVKVARAMATATTVGGKEEGNGKGVTRNGDGNKKGKGKEEGNGTLKK
jgi:hypothetical protein